MSSVHSVVNISQNRYSVRVFLCPQNMYKSDARFLYYAIEFQAFLCCFLDHICFSDDVL